MVVVYWWYGGVGMLLGMVYAVVFLGSYGLGIVVGVWLGIGIG